MVEVQYEKLCFVGRRSVGEAFENEAVCWPLIETLVDVATLRHVDRHSQIIAKFWRSLILWPYLGEGGYRELI
jgi:hypothetical protein